MSLDYDRGRRAERESGGRESLSRPRRLTAGGERERRERVCHDQPPQAESGGRERRERVCHDRDGSPGAVAARAPRRGASQWVAVLRARVAACVAVAEDAMVAGVGLVPSPDDGARRCTTRHIMDDGRYVASRRCFGLVSTRSSHAAPRLDDDDRARVRRRGAARRRRRRHVDHSGARPQRRRRRRRAARGGARPLRGGR